jgi:hypothetical protein
MKTQIKYAFLSGFHMRGIAFAVVFAVNFVFCALATAGLLPLAAQITAVAVSGMSVAVMFIFNVIRDIAVFHRMFAAPGAYLYALTPVPRWKTLLSSVIAVTVMDVVSMTVACIGTVWLSLTLAGEGIMRLFWDAVRNSGSEVFFGILMVLLLLAGYLLFLTAILFCVTMRKSVFYPIPAGGLLTALTAVGVFYAVSVTPLLLAPFGSVTWFFGFITVSLGGAGLVMYLLLTLLQAAALFIATAILMERKINL